MKRHLIDKEIEEILNSIPRNRSLPKRVAGSILTQIRNKLRVQLQEIEIHPEIIPNLKRKIIDQYGKSVINPGENVGMITAQSIGENHTQTTLNSLDWKEEVLYTKDGNTVIQPIGKMIDILLENNQEGIQHIPENRTEYLSLPNGYLIPSCDEDGNCDWYKIEAVTRHLPVGDLVCVKTFSGREVTATQSKSFLVWDGSKFAAVNGSDVKVGDFIPTTNSLPHVCLHDSLKLSDYIDIGGVEFPDVLELDDLLGFVMGMFIACGYVEESSITFITESLIVRQRIIEFFDKYGIEVYTGGDMCATSSIFSRFFTETCDNNIPYFISTAPKSFIRNFLNGYFSGCGSVGEKSKNLVLSHKSVGIQTFVSFLLSYFNTHTHMLNGIGRSSFLTIKREYDGFLLSNVGVDVYTDEVPSYQPQNSDHPTDRDVTFDRVVSVEYVKGSTEFVYDLTVETTRNFQLFNGINIRDTFHSCGTGSTTVLKGIPRFSELIGASHNPKTPSCTIYFDRKFESIDELRRFTGHSIQEITLDDICSKWAYSPVVVEKPWHAVYDAMNPYANTYDWREYPHNVVFSLDVLKLVEFQISINEVTAALSAHFHDLRFIPSPTAMGELEVHADMRNITIEDTILFINRDNHEQIYMEEVVVPKLKKVKLFGIDGIKRVSFVDKGEDGWVVETMGSNFTEVLSMQFVDKVRTITNDMHDINNTFGIEATREFLIAEFKDILTNGGSGYIHDGHVMLVVDVMTFSGLITAINRHGNKHNSSVISRATFEESLENFMMAGVMGVTESTDPISSSIIFGRMAKVGTGVCDIVQQIPEE